MHPLEQPIERVLSAIVRFDGPDVRRSAETAREVRLALQHLVSVASTEGGEGSEEVLRIVPNNLLYATGWSTGTLAAIHRDLQFVTQNRQDRMV